MARWSGWLVAITCVGYVLAVAFGSAAWQYFRALADLRRRGVEPGQLYVVVHPPLWWYVALVLPPMLLTVWWATRRT